MKTEQAQTASVQVYPLKVRCMEPACEWWSLGCGGHQLYSKASRLSLLSCRKMPLQAAAVLKHGHLLLQAPSVMAVRTSSVGDPAGLPTAEECYVSSSTGNFSQSAYDPCSEPPTPPGSPQAECSCATYPRRLRQSHRDSFAAVCEDTAAAALRTSKDWVRANLRTSSETECKDTEAVSQELSREHREHEEPFALRSPPVLMGSVPCMRQGSCKEHADMLADVSHWRSCGGIAPATARHSDQEAPCSHSAVQQIAEPDVPLSRLASAVQLTTIPAASQPVIAAGGLPSSWNEVPDDILRTVFAHMPSAYVRVARLVCKVSGGPWYSPLNNGTGLQSMRVRQAESGVFHDYPWGNVRRGQRHTRGPQTRMCQWALECRAGHWRRVA